LEQVKFQVGGEIPHATWNFVLKKDTINACLLAYIHLTNRENLKVAYNYKQSRMGTFPFLPFPFD
jgi:hypothetical protein